ncbi:pyridoxal-phosphate-dependent aminotransferase family protein [Ornithinibacillus contaminans]|uniref:pyridoxal-phosphate-dependent aminotransferase family protein n=1 Tax=Ornithinibacillus contaminans TaxID=694055 RepID=UPI00064DA01E|nr:alanine--glyoxylate aminotransferase family protein [Ornithinibacillus contaminans]
MLEDYQLLRIPGPTPVPPSVQRAMLQPMIGHRDQETKDLLTRIQSPLKAIFGTELDVFIIAGSGTAALEAAVVNTVEAKEEVLVLVTGTFGDRFAKICEANHIAVHRYETKWGNALNTKKIRDYLAENPSITAVFATYCETSTGVLNPIQELAQEIKKVSDALLIVDGVSCVGAVETKMDEWGIDVLITGSQKALMLPPGLSFIAASPKAWQRIARIKQHRFYFDLRKYHDSLQQDSTPFTPAISLLYGLEQSLHLIEKEGLPSIYSRHQLMKDMTRAAFRSLRIPLLTNDADASPTVTAIKPTSFQPDMLRHILKKEFGLVVAGGQNKLKGKIFRIGHMGYCHPADILQIISCIELGLRKMGQNIALGSGTKAAQQVYLKYFQGDEDDI